MDKIKDISAIKVAQFAFDMGRKESLRYSNLDLLILLYLNELGHSTRGELELKIFQTDGKNKGSMYRPIKRFMDLGFVQKKEMFDSIGAKRIKFSLTKKGTSKLKACT